jgi:SPP1 gp7 family putative phage head morphogenesis protein
MEDNFPWKIELAYSKALSKIIDLIKLKIREFKTTGNIKGQVSKTNSSDEVLGSQMMLEFTEEQKEEILSYFDELFTTDYAYTLCYPYILETLTYAVDYVNGQIGAIVGIDYKMQPFYNKNILKKVLAENVALIKAEPAKYLRSYDKVVANLVEKKLDQGWSLKTLTEVLEKTTGLEKNRAKLIATDQVGNIFAEQTKMQFLGIGLERFRWITSRDSRVRPTHKDREDKIYYWSNPPDGEIPGSAIRCRCTASVVKKDVLDLLT